VAQTAIVLAGSTAAEVTASLAPLLGVRCAVSGPLAGDETVLDLDTFEPTADGSNSDELWGATHTGDGFTRRISPEVRIYIYTHVCMFIYICMCMSVRTTHGLTPPTEPAGESHQRYVCIHVYIHIHTRMYVYICMYVCEDDALGRR